MSEQLRVGTRVVKESGDYVFRGYIVAAFNKTSGAPRYVVENADGVLMIMAPHQLKRFEESDKRDTPRPDAAKQYTGSLRTRR